MTADQATVEHEVEDGRLVIYTNVNLYLHGPERTQELVDRLRGLFGYEVTLHKGVITIWKNSLHDDEFSDELIEEVITAVELTFADIYLTQPA